MFGAGMALPLKDLVPGASLHHPIASAGRGGSDRSVSPPGRYDILFMPPSFPFGGMENPCLTFVTPCLLAGDRSLADVIIHEISHSWFGNLVTNASWGEFWLNEGFTMYAQRRISTEVYGAWPHHVPILFLLSQLMSRCSFPPVAAPIGLTAHRGLVGVSRRLPLVPAQVWRTRAWRRRREGPSCASTWTPPGRTIRSTSCAWSLSQVRGSEVWG